MAKRKARQVTTTQLVLADIPERNTLRALQKEISDLRHFITALDDDIEQLRRALLAFEEHYHSVMAAEESQRRQNQALMQQMQRWQRLIRQALQERSQIDDSLHQQRINETHRAKTQAQLAEQAPSTAPPRSRNSNYQRTQTDEQTAPIVKPQDQLKKVFRELVRRFHPDLARTENERLELARAWPVLISSTPQAIWSACRR